MGSCTLVSEPGIKFLQGSKDLTTVEAQEGQVLLLYKPALHIRFITLHTILVPRVENQ